MGSIVPAIAGIGGAAIGAGSPTLGVGIAFAGLPVTVPSDFMGMCLIDYPNSGTSPVGLLNWKNNRMTQQVEARWSTIETSAGSYSASALTNLDNLITFYRQNGSSVTFGVYSCPAFYANNVTANPTYTDAVTKDGWGTTGGAANPDAGGANSAGINGLTALSTYSTMIATRYNGGGAWQAANPTLGKGIQYWETWNEPAYNANTGATGGNGNSTGAGAIGGGYFWGSAAQCVDVAQTQYAAVKAVDSSIKVLMPGQTGAGRILQFLAATGTTTSKTGAQSCDGVAYHPYQQTPPGVSYGIWTGNDIISGTNGVTTIKNYLSQNGYPGLAIYITEYGIDTLGSTTTVQNWYASSYQFKYTWYVRLWMAMAAQGVQAWHPWNWAETSTVQGNSGCWVSDTSIQQAYNDFVKKVCGKTITAGRYLLGSTVSLTFSDGTSWTV